MRQAAEFRQRSGTMQAAARSLDGIETARFVTWLYRDQKAHICFDRGLFDAEAAYNGAIVRRSSADGVAKIEKIGLVGVRVDEFGPDAGEMHDDAIEAHTFILRQGLYELSLYGRNGSTPDWGGDFYRLEPHWKREPAWEGYRTPRPGSYRLIYRPPSKEPIACALAPPVQPEFVRALCDEYTAWRTGLQMLFDHFTAKPGLLKRYKLTPPEAPVEPWRAFGGGWRAMWAPSLRLSGASLADAVADYTD